MEGGRDGGEGEDRSQVGGERLVRAEVGVCVWGGAK